MSKKISGEKVEASSSFRSAKNRASAYANDAARLNDLLDEALKKAISRKGLLTEVWDSLMACVRLLRAYATGQYRGIPWASLLSIIAAVTYFVMPIDLIPDFILTLGFVDDVALISWIIGAVKSDIDNFLEWESTRPSLEQDPGASGGG
jgi:uncharacterized membrane protein YkvA (DUF1232 family)